MSGLLTSAIITALRSGVYRIEHLYNILVPEDAAGTGYQSKTIHNLTGGGNVKAVTDHGVMDRTGYNYSVSQPGKLSFGEYKFKCTNHDNAFWPGASIWVHGTTSYEAEPHECKVQRWTYIFTTSWTLLPGTLYNGKIDRVEYNHADFSHGKSITFYCKPLDLEILTGYTWGEDDYDELDLSVTFTGPLPEDN